MVSALVRPYSLAVDAASAPVHGAALETICFSCDGAKLFFSTILACLLRRNAQCGRVEEDSAYCQALPKRRRDGCALDFNKASCDAFLFAAISRACRTPRASTRFAALRTHVNHVIGVRDEIEVVLDHHHGSTLFNESLKYAEERFHIAWVQAIVGSVEHEHGIGLPRPNSLASFKRAPRRPKARAWLRRACEIPQAQVMQGLQLFVRLLDVGHMRRASSTESASRCGKLSAWSSGAPFSGRRIFSAAVS